MKIKTKKEVIEEVEVEFPLFVKDKYYYYALLEEDKFIRVGNDSYEKSISHFVLGSEDFANNTQISKDEFIQAYNEAKEYIESIDINYFCRNEDGE
jgi:hypothetical protein